MRAPKKLFFIFADMKDGVKPIGFMRKERVVENCNHNGGRKFAVPLAFEERLGKEPRPVIQNPLRHIVLVNDLNFHVNPLASVGPHEHVKPIHFPFFELFCQLCVIKLHIDDTIMACPMQNRIQKSDCKLLSARMAEQLLKHKVQF